LVLPNAVRAEIDEENHDVRPVHLDPRSPLVLDVHDLGRRPGSTRLVQRVVAAPDDLGTAVVGIPPGTDLELDLRLEAVTEGVLVTGDVRGQAVGECVRCLDRVDVPVEVRLQELFVYPERQAAVADGDEDEDLRELDGDLADLEPVLRDAIVPVLPFGPLCRDDCPGLCVECGVRLADHPGHVHETYDPRWAALTALPGHDKTKEEG